MRRCIVCHKRIWAVVSVFARTLPQGWVCSKKHYVAVKEAEQVGLGFVYR